MITLGIETSCDETSVAILEGDSDLKANIVSSQVEIHEKFGGVVPEVAARKHTENLNPLLEESFREAGIGPGEVDLIAVTTGPGLVVSLVVGIAAARVLSSTLSIPATGVNHLEGHIMSVPLTCAGVSFPAVCLLVSGGHTEIILVEKPGEYRKMGGTVDDAAGEAFDKISRLLDLGYPGGPAVQEAAGSGDPGKIRFPRPMIADDNFNLSFSGLKTAVVNYLKKEKDTIERGDPSTEDIAASFQEAVADVLAVKTLRAAAAERVGSIWLAGGVAANSELRKKLAAGCEEAGIDFHTPPFDLCTDNAAMIARAGREIFTRTGSGLPLIPAPGLDIGPE